MKKKLVISLGSNLGNRYAYIRQAITHINRELEGICQVAHFYETPPWGDENQATFINTAASIETSISLEQCLTVLQNIEKRMGRVKTKKWGPRSIDLDILFYGNETIKLNHLEVPHKHLHERSFVLVPLCDILPDFVHPILNRPIADLYSEIDNDTTRIF
ncbi:MAG: 2-amino-4-hydroxy-6-hydroxymethyldihydropteridine diphosphokinase [Bacteroidia bacterium]